MAKKPGSWFLRSVATAAALAFGVTTLAQAAPGDRLRSIVAPDPFGCPKNVGLAFDGANLLLTCLTNPQIDFVGPRDGRLLGSRAIAGHRGLAAASWDARRRRLWVCNATDANDPARNVTVFLANPRAGTSRRRFDTVGCHDGLAYDSTDDTLWVSPDENEIVYHYRLDGTVIQAFNVNSPQPLLGGFGNSGIAVAGDALYLANNGGGSVYRVPRDFSSSTLLASFENRRVEDLECDGLTFVGANAVWVQSAFDRRLDALEIPVNSCGPGASPTGTGTIGEEGVAPPVLGRDVNVERVRGSVRLRRKGSSRFLPLRALTKIPVGSTIDTTRGAVALASASNARGGVQRGRFFGGVFTVRQRRTARPVTDILLTGGSFRRCAGSGASAAARRQRSVRHVWSRGSGRFRTRGRYSSASVRGTTWLTADRCDGTLTRVVRGRVRVRDFKRGREVTVPAGRSYLARR